MPDGKRFKVLEWERDFLDELEARPTDDAALSCGRGSGKSALIAALAASVIDPQGPLHESQAEVTIGSASHMQARIILNDVIRFLEIKYGELPRKVWGKSDSLTGAQLEYKPSHSLVLCTGSDPQRWHGRRPKIAILDELAALPIGKAEKMVAVARTSLGKVPRSRLIAIGTRSADVGHPFSGLLKTAKIHKTYSASSSNLTMEAAHESNPSLSAAPFRALRRRVKAELAEAKADPVARAAFVALRLNAGTSVTSADELVTVEEWIRHALGDQPAEGETVWGFDLGGGWASTAISCYWPRTGRLDGFAVWPVEPGLNERSKRHSVGSLWHRAADEGSLLTLGQHAVDLTAAVTEALNRWGPPAAVTYDRWRADLVGEALFKADVPLCPHEVRAMGFVEGAADVAAFRRALLEDRVAATGNVMQTQSFADARLVTDGGGNSKLAKSTEGSRRQRAVDDLAAASVLAVASGSRALAQVEAAV